MHETGVQLGIEQQSGAHDATLLRELDSSLHALSQPITVLLCTLEYGAGLNSVDEMKPLLLTARQASERLRETALAMRARLRTALEEARCEQAGTEGFMNESH